MSVFTTSLTLPEKLKSGTGALHARLESHPHLQQLMSAELTKSHYTRVLALFYGYFAPLESRLNEFPELLEYLPDFPERRKTSALLQDYRFLASESAPEEPLLCSTLPIIKTVSEAFGCLYVMEGSTLGGKFIARHVGQILGPEVHPALTFFTGYGEQTGHYWKTFREALTRLSNTLIAEEEVVQSANDTFQLFYDWMNTSRHG